MSIYAEYIVPTMHWLHNHPNYALLFTFLIAFLESLAIIGTLIPGSLTMTALGILAGSGVMPFDLTLCFAILGAFCGDGVSYIIGRTFSQQLTNMWPFKRYPNLLNYGQDFFNRHGKKSVLIGRFIGPLRSIIPMIAGIMNMSYFHFIVANFISAIGWSILYLIPGYLIGAASTQFSSDSARRLLLFVMIILLSTWIFSHVLQVSTKKLSQKFTQLVNKLWISSKNNPYSCYIVNKLTNKEDKKQQKVIRLLMIALTSILGSLLICVFVKQNTWIHSINQPIALFLQTLRVPLLDHVLIIFTLILSPLSLTAFSLLIAILSIHCRDWRFLKYWCSLMLSAICLSVLCAKYLSANAPIHLFKTPSVATFVPMNLCLASTLFCFLIHYLIKNHKNMSHFISFCLISTLLTSGFASLYLGDNWLSSILGALAFGSTIALLHWIAYRRKHANPHEINAAIIGSICVFILTTTLSYHFNFQNIIDQHTPRPKQYILNEDSWWYQNEPILPLYSTNRIGKRIGVFNVQYAGAIKELEHKLIAFGWMKQSRSFLSSLIIHTEGRHVTDTLPFMEQLYLNKQAILTMSYRTENDDKLYILRLWRSNYHLLHYHDPIWLGNIILAQKKQPSSTSFWNRQQSRSLLFAHILPAVHDYKITTIRITDPALRSLPYEIPSELLIIKN